MPSDFRCYLVSKDAAGKVTGTVAREPLTSLPEGTVLVRVQCSSLNYKDALAATGHAGVVRKFPHVPGIDAVGTVVESNTPDVHPGAAVIVTSYELGAGRWGSWAEFIRVPAEWVLPLPAGLSLREAMILGTAGLTAAMSVETLQNHGVRPESGEVVVTGATGGVGCLAVMLLAKLGYQVAAVTGKAAWHHRLKEWGAAQVHSREDVNDASGKPLLAARWAGAIDTVGGNTLATLLRQSNSNACVAACGLVGGVELPLTIYPFLLRGVTLSGIDSAWCPRERRLSLWNRLAGNWKLGNLESIATTASLDEIGSFVPRILAGQIAGRVVVEV
jgi:acrylyl-CoA reductase (NADPH)